MMFSSFFLILFAVCGVFRNSSGKDIPEPRWAHHMVFDEENKQVLMFGGAHQQKLLGDLWSWNGSSWKLLANSGPAPMCKGVFVYDSHRKAAVLFGCVNAKDERITDTWIWKNKSWEKANGVGPPSRVHALGTFDRNTNLVLMFGGFGDGGPLSDTWAFDGDHWKLLDNQGPKDRIPHGMYWDGKRKSVMMITVELNKTPGNISSKNEWWQWSGSGWKLLPDAVPSIQALQAFSVFGENKLVVYDGTDLSNTSGVLWQHMDGKWESTSNPNPKSRMGHIMVYDPIRKRLVLFGGGKEQIFFNDTWEWDGKNWKKC